jgi:hypothetical protein
MTVEAALILPVFILFFASLMSLVSLIQTLITLDGAVQASAREMAVYAYPMERIATGLGGSIPEDVNLILPETVRNQLARRALESRLKETRVPMEQIRILAAEFPQGEDIFGQRKAAGEFDGFDGDFGCDDVFLYVMYTPGWLGWVPGLDGGVPLKAMERGWLKGQGVLFAPDEREDSIFRKDEETVYVYVTRTGIRYHLGDCRYLRKSKIPMTLKEAARSSYTPCKVCAPPAAA